MWRMPATVLLLSAALASAAAADAKLGAFIGCFDIKYAGWIYNTTDYTRAKAFSKTTITSCKQYCSGGHYSLAIVSSDFRCRCTLMLPIASARWNNPNCVPSGSSKGMPAAVYYLHKGAGSSQCRLANVPMTWNDWNIAHNWENVNFEGNRMSVRLQGTTGSRLTTKDGDHLYGQWQVRAKVSGAVGAVTAFYLRSNDVYPNDWAPPFSEIDIEWVNGRPAKESGSIWFNLYTDSHSSGEQLLPPSQYQKALGYPRSKKASNSYITYTINWQPDFVVWAVDGKVFRFKKNGDKNNWTDMNGKKRSAVFRSPNQPCHTTLSFWTDAGRDRPPERMFGGPLDQSRGPYYSYFKSLRRVVCDRALPNRPDALGPKWMTDVLYKKKT